MPGAVGENVHGVAFHHSGAHKHFAYFILHIGTIDRNGKGRSCGLTSRSTRRWPPVFLFSCYLLFVLWRLVRFAGRDRFLSSLAMMGFGHEVVLAAVV